MLLAYAHLFSADSKHIQTAQGAGESHVLWNGNQISTVHGNHGDFASYHVTGNSGMEWPKGSGKLIVFQAGLWLAAGKVNGQEEIRTAASEYTTEFESGSKDGDTTSGQIYQIHKKEIDLFQEYGWDTFTALTMEIPVTIIEGATIYTVMQEVTLPTDDFLNWPVEEGAPWVDVTEDGFYQPEQGDYPDIQGDIFHWYVMNDLNGATHTPLWGTNPLGVEVRASMFGFDREGPIGNTLFVKYEIKNVGSELLDSMFVAIWSDPDLGDASDDLVGTDTLLDMMYCYNDIDGDGTYGIRTPTVSHVFLQTPMVPSTGDTAYLSGIPFDNYKNLPLYASAKYIGGSPIYSDPNRAIEAYRWMNGRIGPSGDLFTDPTTGKPTRYVHAGDPVTGEGWIDDTPGDRRQLMSSGPFSLAPGEVQEVVAAIVISQGNSWWQSIAALRQDVAFIHDIWNSGYDFLEPVAAVSDLVSNQNTEETGPFYMAFQVDPNPGWDLDEASLELHYGLETIDNIISLEHELTSPEQGYGAWIPGSPGADGTRELSYYLSMSTTDGIPYMWPSGAPFNYQTMIFGPDTVAPKVTVLNEIKDVHYRIPFRKQMFATVDEDRHGIESWIMWQVGDWNSQADVMAPDSNRWRNMTGGLPGGNVPIWYGDFTSTFFPAPDTVFVWVEAVDSSRNRNVGRSEKQWFLARDSLAIGDWENYTYGEWDGWNVMDDPFGNNWGRVLARAFPPGDADTTFRTEPLDLTFLDTVSLTFKSSRKMTSGEAFGYLDISSDGENWNTLYSVTGDTSSETARISIPDANTLGSVYFRLRHERSTTNSTWWILDDIMLDSDYEFPIVQVTDISQLENTEKTGDFYLRFRINPVDDWELGSGHTIQYGVGAITDTLFLVKINYDGQPAYTVRIPDLGVTGTSRLHYYLTIRVDDGTVTYWPEGGPARASSMLFGPDTTAPAITYLSRLKDVHYLVPFNQQVLAYVEDRFEVTPTLHWQVGDGSVKSVSMLPDSTWLYSLPPQLQIIWKGNVSRSTLNLGDTVFYWIEVEDNSAARNKSISEKKYFMGRQEQVIASWKDGDGSRWDLWDYGIISDDPSWGQVLTVNLTSNARVDTCTFLDPLDLRYIDGAGLEIPSRRQMVAGEDFGFVEASLDGEEWKVVYTVTGDTTGDVLKVNLSSFTRHEQVHIRFRIQRNSSRSVAWVMGNILFHTDLSRLEIIDPVPIPDTYALHPNFPNPFNPVTTIRYDIPQDGHMTLTIYDILGREVAVLIDEVQPAGYHQIRWDAGNAATGIYFLRMASGDFSRTRKVMVLK